MHPSNRSHRLRVLVVDDEPRMRDLLSEVIPDMGFETTVCRSAEEAIRVHSADPRQIVFLDLQLPAMGGMDLFDRIRKDWPSTQVIVLTGFGSLESARRAIHLNVVDFLTKPCHLRDIELALDRARRRIEASPDEAIAIIADDESAAPTLAEIEKREILHALERTAGNRTQAAKQLGISRRTLHYRLREYGMKS